MSSKTKSELNSRIVGSKLWLIWLWLSAGIVCLADIAVLIVLGIEGVQGTYYVLPIVFLALDVIVTILSAVTNHRFKRALAAPIVYAVLKLAIVILAVMMLFGDTVIFSTLAVTLWLVFEFFSIVCIILSAIFAKGSGRGFLAIVAVLTVAIIAFGAVYTVFVSTSGFFGQNKEKTFEKRTLVYSYYDDDRDSLVVSDVLDGNGNTVVVPSEFNGMEVKGIDCTIFAQDGVDTVVLRCSEDVEFRNPEELCYMGDDVSVYADPDCIDTYREYFYSLSIDEIEKSLGVSTYSRRTTPKSLAEAYAAFANSMYPEVEDGEDGVDNVYVTVEIDYNYLPAFKNGDGEYEIPAVWIADRGSEFNPYEIYGYGYTEHMDEWSESDLCWCYYNFSNYILTDFTGPDGETVVGTKISDSVTVSAKMTEIYAVEVGESNDTVHTEPGLNRDFYGGYRYVTESTADKIMEGVKGRTGFTLSWEYSLSGSETRRAFTTLVGRLSDEMMIYPVWTMEAPKISASADSYTVVYGNTVSFTSVGSFADGEVALAYVWTHGTDTESEKQNFEKENMDPTKDGGTYTVTVTAGGDDVTSLTTTASASVFITVNKRNLVLEWSTTSSSVYSGNDETVSVDALKSSDRASETSGVINGDTVTFTLDRSEIINDAGRYDFEATLAALTDYYVISENATWSFTIAKYTLYVVWSVETLIYNGTEQRHSYSYKDASGEPITALGGDMFGVELLGESISGVGTNAGEHTATLSITNANYELATGTAQDKYTITQKEVTVTWNPDSSYTYKGEAQYPKATPSGILYSETGIVELTYTGYGTDVGEYTVTLGISSANYILVEGNETSNKLSYTYTIKQKTITITWQETRSFVYDGYSKTITATISDADVEAVDKGLIALSYSGDVNGIINANADSGVYTVTAAVANTGTSDRARNYTISNSVETFTITKKSGFSIEGQNLVKEQYDGTSFADDVTYKYSGLAETDDGQDVVTVTKVEYSVTSTATALDAAPVDVGEYTVTIYFSAGEKIGNYDYTVPGSVTGSVTIKPAILELSWNDESLIYNGESQHITAAITSGIVGSEEVTLNYSVQKVQDGSTVDSYADATSYYVTVSLGEDGTNYEMDSNFTATKTYTIAPYDIRITWGRTTLSYNGDAQVPSYSYDNTIWCAGSVGTFLSVSGHVTDVGQGTAEISSTDSNYTFSNKSCAFEVVAKVITVTWYGYATYTYNGSEQAPYATIDEQLYERDGMVNVVYTYNDSSDMPKNVGDYEIVATLSCSNYVIGTGYDKIEFEIVAKELSLTWTNENYDDTNGCYAYTYEKNTAYKPTYTVNGLVGSETGNITVTYYMVSGSLTITVDAPTNAGNYVVVVTSGDSNYNLSEQKEILINPKPVTIGVTWNDATTFIYDGTQVEYVPTVTLSESATDLERTVSYVYTSDGVTLDGAPKDAGEYTLTITVSISDGNYVLIDSTVYEKSYVITARTLTVQDATTTSFVYSGNSTKPSYTVVGLVGEEDGSIIETYYTSGDTSEPLDGAPVNAGSYVLVLTSGDPNYSMNVSISFEITKKEVSATVSWPGDSPYTYDGAAKEHLATITIEDSPSYEAVYSYSYTEGNTLGGAPVNVGSYTVTVKLTMTDGNYAFTGTTEFSDSYVIQAKTLSVKVETSQQELTYNGTKQTPKYTVMGLEGEDDGSVIETFYLSSDTSTSLGGAPTDVGSYVLSLTSGDSNYLLYSWIAFVIVPMPVTPGVSWSEKSYVYDGTAKGHLPEITIENLTYGTDYTVGYSYNTDGANAPTNVGEYTVTVTITLTNTNYKLTASVFEDNYQITKKEITVTAQVNQSFVYDGSAKSPSYTADNIVSGDTVQIDGTYYSSNNLTTSLPGAPADAGTYVLRLTTTASNYFLDVSIEFEISPAILTATVTWTENESHTYDGADKTPTAVSITLSNTSIDFTTTYTYRDKDGKECTPRDAGTYTVELTIKLTSSNYALEEETFTHEFTIKEAELTISWTYKGSYSSSDNPNHPTAEVVCSVSGETVAVSYTYCYDDGTLYGDGTTAPTDAGSYKVVITLTFSGSGDNYTVTGSYEKSYTIVAGDVN